MDSVPTTLAQRLESRRVANNVLDEVAKEVGYSKRKEAAVKARGDGFYYGNSTTRIQVEMGYKLVPPAK